MKFEVGDRVKMPGVPIVVEVSGFGICDEEGCLQPDLFCFRDPVTGEEDWMHVAEFELVS